MFGNFQLLSMIALGTIDAKPREPFLANPILARFTAHGVV